MQRFFVAPALLQDTLVELPAPVAHQLTHVLRARQGDHIILLDGSGWEYEAELTSVAGRRVTAAVLAKTQPLREPRIHLTLYQALIREAKFDWVLQKGTELGISSFVPMFSERSLTGIPSPAKYERWQRIITEAAEQSGRTRLPTLTPPLTYESACIIPPGVPGLLASPEQALPLGQSLPDAAPSEIRLYIGPEGGFSEGEVAYARQMGLIIVRLGERILRTETASLAALAAILMKYGEI